MVSTLVEAGKGKLFAIAHNERLIFTQTRTSRNEMTANHVLLHAFEVVDLAIDGCFVEQEAVYTMRKALNGMKPDEAVDNILNMFARTKNNEEFVQMVKKTKFL